MIVSASRRTDIPAFFGEWFMERIRAAEVEVLNPFDPRRSRVVSLKPADVEAICFWSKNPRPFLPHLEELTDRGFWFFFHFTLNPYDRPVEPHLPPLTERIDTFLTLSSLFGPKRVIWRYDPIIISPLTPVDWHLERMEAIAATLAGHTARLVVSMVDRYRKNRCRLERVLGKGIGEEGAVFADDVKRLSSGIVRIAREKGMIPTSCAEPLIDPSTGIAPGACIDAGSLEELCGILVAPRRDRSQRSLCRCVRSVDVGRYGTCRHGCIYCYAC